MSTDYFTHAAFGVELDNGDREKLNEVLARRMQSGGYTSKSLDKTEYVNRYARKLLAELRKKYGAPSQSVAIYTGSSDDRPGSCLTDPDLWLLGIGMYGFGVHARGCRIMHELSTRRFKQAKWHTWVTSG